MVLFVEILKWYSVIFVCIIEFILLYNVLAAATKKETIWQTILGIFLYLPLLFLTIWALGHGFY
jgi:hypothetical protein